MNGEGLQTCWGFLYWKKKKAFLNSPSHVLWTSNEPSDLFIRCGLMERAVRVLAQWLVFVHMAWAKRHRVVWQTQAINCKVLRAGMWAENGTTIHQQFCGWNQQGSSGLWWVFPATEKCLPLCRPHLWWQANNAEQPLKLFSWGL